MSDATALDSPPKALCACGKPARRAGECWACKDHRLGRHCKPQPPCVTCGAPIAKSLGGIRKYCGPACKPRRQATPRRLAVKVEMRCGYCDARFEIPAREVARGQRCCSKSCAKRLVARPAASSVFVGGCDECGKSFTSRTRAAVCSDGCRTARTARLSKRKYHADKAAQGDGRTPVNWRLAVDRRAERLRDVYVENVAVQVLAERDAWRCHLCGKAVPRRAQHPDPLSASVDHLVPISLGGEHSYRNTALAHLRCNLSKSTRPAGEQLRLIG